nr:AAA family ATPase [Paludibacteraceae bacterium]
METNIEIELAWRCVVQTGTHLFLTGKAGTGKTTFLQKLKEASPKRMLVLAPTGIAAINAGGVTIHSFFQLPFAPYIPGTEFSTDKKFLFSKEKINIIRSLDLLVIDEISMVRADLLDSIDEMLRRYRRTTVPFGGVQLLLIGDLHQLSPVVKDTERNLLEQYYDGVFFFNSKALQQTPYITIELKQVFRQTEVHFLHLLNQIRNNDASAETLAELNKRYIPGFSPKEDEKYIRLTTHNNQAYAINQQHLAEIDAEEFTFASKTEGNFPPSSYPTEEYLVLKKGAQIMFIKNDVTNPKRFYNGKLGKVVSISAKSIEVQGENDAQSFMLEKATWTNAKYVLNKDTNEIAEEIEGYFEQYPLRLAWAITIHKSQGLTFDRAIIDAASSFAHGQTYVALSRCRTLDGLVLGAPIPHRAIIKDAEIHEFDAHSEANAPDEARIVLLEKTYFYQLVSEMVQFTPLYKLIQRLVRLFEQTTLHALYPQLTEQLRTVRQTTNEKIVQVSERFIPVFSSLFRASTDYTSDAALHERIQSAAQYFSTLLEKEITPFIADLEIDIDSKETEQQLADIQQQCLRQLRVHHACLASAISQNFSVHAYQKAKLEASIEKNESKKRTSTKEKKTTVVASDEIPHPALYEELRSWRKEEAEDRSLPVYAIMHQKALLGIVQSLPTSDKELLAVPHVGKRTVQQYGES